MTRFLAALLALLTLSAPALAQTRALPPGEIRANGDITFGNALKLGKRDAGKTIITPDALQILGPGSTGDASTMSVAPTGFGATAASLTTLLGNAKPRVATNAALKALLLPYSRISRDGFAAAGDGGAVDYTWSPSNCTAADDGAQVQPTGRAGCWIADLSGGAADVRVWGAQPGQQIDAALRAAIAWACTTHKPLVLPYSYPSQYLLNSQINIGDGSAAAYSTCNNISLEMTGPDAVTTSSTNPAKGMSIRYNGPVSATTIPINVQGPIKGARLKGLSVTCDFKCSTGIRASTVLDGEFKDLSVEHNINGPAFDFTSEAANQLFSSFEGTRVDNIHADFPGTGGSGIRIGPVNCSPCNYGVLGNIFTNMTFNYDGNVANTFGLQFGMASQNTLINIRTTPYFVGGGTPGNLGNSIKITPPTGRNDYPTGNVFIHPLIAGPVDPGPDANSWVPSAGGFNFVGWSTVYLPFPTATVSGRFTGSDARGNTFSEPPKFWTPTDASGAGLTFTVNDAQYVINGKTCTVTFSLVWPTTSNTAVAATGGLPCRAQAGGTSRHGGAPSYTDQGSPLTILIGSGTTQANFYSFGGAGLVNSQFSGKTVRATLTYAID